MRPYATRRVSIPVTISPAPAATDPPSGDRILLVSSDPDLRAVLSRVLEQEGYAVDAVAHSGHALLLCRSAAFSVLLAELCGPDMSGPTLADHLRRHCPGIASVYLANPGTPEGVDHLMVRPFTRDDLLTRIRMAVSGARASAR